MDFITLAEETNPLRIMRLVKDALVDSSDEVVYNDLLDDSSSSRHLQATANTSSNKPLLSKAAEAELFLLATNFLLYVAMVIIATMVAKIYFPESLQRAASSPRSARSFSYRMAADGTQDEEEYYGSDVEDEDDDVFDEEDDDDEDVDDDGDDVEEVLDSGDEAEEEEEEGRDLLINRRGAGGANNKNGTGATTAAQRIRNRYNFLEFQQKSLSKTQVFKRLIFCSIMLNITFVLWGVLQERMLTRKYPRYTGEYFTYSYALVFTNRFWTMLMSGMLMLYLKPRRSRTTVIYEYSFPSISNMLSSWCQYEALRYVSFPATTIFKSFKLAPVMAMGRILGNKTYPTYDYFVALLIGVGIAMFMTSTDDLRFGYDIYGDQVSTAWTGVMLLFLFLFFDSFTSQFQSRMFQRHRDLSMVELMFATSAFSTILSLVTLVHTKELYPAFDFVMQHSEIHLHFLLFSICSTIGQLFIFYTIKNFGAVVFTLIMTTRILLSIALSCIMYGHKVTATGFFGLCLVMAAVLYRIRRKAQGQQILKWQGMEDGGAKSHELVQEWHEHVDM